MTHSQIHCSEISNILQCNPKFTVVYCFLAFSPEKETPPTEDNFYGGWR